jgi:Rrf2 family transcriptional regulator, iron-sulfur cluster assembly transcription factor
MKLSTKGRYAVRALVDLSRFSDQGPVNLKSISEREGISVSYLEQLFNRLRRNGIVKSVRGPGGGYLLARPRAEISIAQIVEAVEEQMALVDCVLFSKDDAIKGCERVESCITRLVWQDLGNRIHDFLDSITMEDLFQQTNKFMSQKSDSPATC